MTEGMATKWGQRQTRAPGPPRGARQLIEARSKGLRPAGNVIVSLTGKRLPNCDNLTIYAEPRETYDWSILGGLDVEILADRLIPLEVVVTVLEAVGGILARSICLTYHEGLLASLGDLKTVFLEQEKPSKVFDWYPEAIWDPEQVVTLWGVKRYEQSRKLAARLASEIGFGLPDWYGQALKEVQRRIQREQAKHGANDRGRH